jgi:hypothetical protein
LTSEETTDTATQQNSTTDDGFLRYTDDEFDMTIVDMTVFGKKIYEWTPEELMQYIYDSGIYNKVLETYMVTTEGDGWTANGYSIENIGYHAERTVFDYGMESVDLLYDNYSLSVNVYGISSGWIYIYANEPLGLWDDADIQDSITGKTLYEFFGNEEMVTALQNQKIISFNNAFISSTLDENGNLNYVNIWYSDYNDEIYYDISIVVDNGVITGIEM